MECEQQANKHQVLIVPDSFLLHLYVLDWHLLCPDSVRKEIGMSNENRKMSARELMEFCLANAKPASDRPEYEMSVYVDVRWPRLRLKTVVEGVEETFFSTKSFETLSESELGERARELQRLLRDPKEGREAMAESFVNEMWEKGRDRGEKKAGRKFDLSDLL